VSTEEHTDTDASEFAEAEFGLRRLSGLSAALIPVIAAGWSLFQLSLPQLLLLNSEIVRCIHLAFAMTLVYLSFPMIKGARLIRWLGGSSGKGMQCLHNVERIYWIDYLFAVIAAVAALYLALDYEGIAQRQGTPMPRDLVLGVILIVALLEAARRALGKPLPIIAAIFILYCFFSESMPDLIAFKNASLRKVISKLTLSTEGIYGVPLDVSAQTVFLFVLFGAMLEKAGGGQYFIQLAFSLLGRFKGGPAKAAVLASGLTGMVSGSSIANTVTTGTFTIPLMKRAGYPAVKAGAIEVAASTNGQLMPPIMGAAAFIIAEYCGLTYFEVVRAAFIPAVISYIALIYITHLEASKLGLKGMDPAEIPRFWKTFRGGIHFLIPLGFLLYQLIIERRSAQLSAYYAILSLAALVTVRNIAVAARSGESVFSAIPLTARSLWDSLVAGGRNMMSIGVAVAAAGIIVGIVTLGLGNAIVDVIEVLSMGNLVLLLLITAVVSLVLGMGLPTTANYIVMATLTVPVIVCLGEDMGLVIPLIAAHLFCFFFGILADDTPPVGLAAYAAAAISRADPIKTGIQGFKYDIRTAILPFMFIFNTDLLLHNVHGATQVIMIFVTGVVAMFSFAALTQGYLIARNRIHESLLLMAAALVLLRPDLLMDWFGLPKPAWYVVGIAIFAATHALQWPRRGQPATGS
jgi:TRAP transporter 4TM/12TM fusion protein